ncbi:diguanylate cyclase domain-containing protein [Paenibacillus abyssi]|uniref:Diguanylate cyclase n=1 Tax=Paenibacillus abyssi TaxID=1340531 RepID=A0A917G6X3_9BACL|nr:diguanylate cyclase [Paenibacillus abyssi]GGG25666.1 hypothetical protein GCM10010916_47630 [Paenibacillus abyssi]
MDSLLRRNDLNGLLIHSLLEPAVIINKQGTICSENQAWLELRTRNDANVRGVSSDQFLDLYKDQDKFTVGIVSVLTGGLPAFHYDAVHPSKEGDQFFTIRVTPIKNEHSNIEGALIVYCNITAQKKLEQTLRNGAEQYRLIAEHSQDTIKVTDIHGKIEYASPSHKKIFDYMDETTDIFEFIHPDDVEKFKSIYQDILQTKESQMLEFRKKYSDGVWGWLEASCSPVMSEEGTVQNIIVVSRDISDRKKYERELEYMAFHDFLTGLYNRRKIRMFMEEALLEASQAGQRVGFIIMDLDKFKTINDTYGHDVGDLMLKEFSRRLLHCRREGDAVGRLSGDEFAIVLKDLKGDEDVNYYIRQFMCSLTEPCFLPDTEYNIQVCSSAGYAIYPDHGDTVVKLVKHADIQLYKEKRRRIKLGIPRKTFKKFQIK